MGKVLLNKLYLTLYLLIGSLLLEVINFHLLNFGFMPEKIWYDFAILLFIACIIAAIPSYIAQYILSTILLFIQSVLIYANYSLQTIYKGEIFTFDMLSLVGEGAAAMSSNFIYIAVALQIVGVFVLIATIGAKIYAHCKSYKIELKKKCFVSVAVLAICSLCSATSVGAIASYRDMLSASISITDEDYILSNAFLMGSSILKETSYRRYGTFGFYTNLLLSRAGIDEKTQKAVEEYFNKGQIYDNSPVFGVDKNNNVITIMMESLEWLGFGDGNYDKDVNNLSEEITPNIYSIIYGDEGNRTTTKQSITATNFFAKAKTNYSEAYGILGNYPVAQNLPEIAGNNYDPTSQAFGYSLPNVLNKLGYTTTYAHSNRLTFYQRNDTHNNLGFTNLVGKDTLVDEHGNLKYTGEDLYFHHWIPESDFVRQSIDKIVPESAAEGVPFYTFYLTVSTHGGYDDNVLKQDQARYKNYVMYGADDCVYNEQTQMWELINKPADQLTYTDWYTNIVLNYGEDEIFVKELVNYECCVKGLDDAVGVIIKKLKEYDIYDKTTILLYSDHNAYYSDTCNRIRNIELDDTTKMIELNTVPFILSSPGVKANNVAFDNRFCSAYDIIPTILDLLGIKFNQNLYVGSSLFGDAQTYQLTKDGVTQTHAMNIYYSNTGGMYCQDMYTNNLECFYQQNYPITPALEKMFKTKATTIITKLNYLNILNNNQTLYKKLTNNFNYLTQK